MSNVFWQTLRQQDQLPNGKTVTGKVKTYVKEWENRCYCDGIPDEIDKKLAASGRVPSYKAIAIALLKNDASMKALGFCPDIKPSYTAIKKMSNVDKQLRLF